VPFTLVHARKYTVTPVTPPLAAPISRTSRLLRLITNRGLIRS